MFHQSSVSALNRVQAAKLTPSSDTFLRVCRPFQLGKLALGIHGPKEDGLKLVHSCTSNKVNRSRCTVSHESLLSVFAPQEEGTQCFTLP
jgi:hypothetical protein